MDKGSVFHFGGHNLDANKRPRYLDEQAQKKLTYNFVTSKGLKRGHNFGVVYFTPNTLEEELKSPNTNKKPLGKMTKTEKEKDKIRRLEEDVVAPVSGRVHAAVSTTPVESTLRPKPLTLTKSIQTTDFIDRPRSPLTWHQPTGIHAETQIMDGDLFNFDFEVEPILNVLVSKTLEQSRMEVLEEEEISVIQKNQRNFEELRNRELMEVQRLEDAETRRKEEINRRLNQQKEQVEQSKVIQKKIFSRFFAKEYLGHLKPNCMTYLLKNGIFQKETTREFYFNLVPSLQSKVETSVSNNLSFINKLDFVFSTENYLAIKKSHKEAIEREYTKREDEKLRKKLEKERKREERRLKIEEEARLKKEKEREELKNFIITELLKNAEMADETAEVYEPDGSMLVGKKYAALTGGFFTQWATIISAMNLINPDSVNAEKLSQTLLTFIPRFPVINIHLPDQLYETIQQADPTIATPDDLIKMDETQWVKITEYLSNHKSRISSLLLDLLAEKYTDISKNYSLVLEVMLKLYRSTPEFDKYFKFSLKDPLYGAEDDFKAVFYLTHDEFLKPKQAEPIVKKANNKKPVKITYDPEILEKFPICSTANDKLKIISFNNTYDRIIRHNIIECLYKLNKIDSDKETIKQEIEANFLEIQNLLQQKVAEEYHIDLFEYYLQSETSDPQVQPN